MRRSVKLVYPGYILILLYDQLYEKCEDTKTKGLIRSRHEIEKENNKRTYNDLPNTTQKNKDRATRTPLNTGGELRCSRRISCSCSIGSTHRVVEMKTTTTVPQELRKSTIHTNNVLIPAVFYYFVFYLTGFQHDGLYPYSVTSSVCSPVSLFYSL